MRTEVMKEFDLLCQKAEYAWKNNRYGTRELEPYLLEILEYVKKNIKFRKELSQGFINLINKKYPVHEVLVFCMRELQWEEVLQAAINCYNFDEDLRAKSIINHIIEVYDPDWENYDLYLYYCGETTRKFISIREKIKKFVKKHPHDIKELEKYLLDLLNFVKNHIADKEQLIECFSDLVHVYRTGSYEMVSFCMRELQWTEIKEAVIKIYNISKDPKEKSKLKDILTAYEPQWKDAGLYEYYKNKI